jgi:hypothetical protein
MPPSARLPKRKRSGLLNTPLRTILRKKCAKQRRLY